MTLFQVMIDIKGLHDVLKFKNVPLEIDDVLFIYDGQYYRARVTIDTENIITDSRAAKQIISTALSKIIFAYNTEAFVSETGFYFKDVQNSSDVWTTAKSMGIRYSIEDKNATDTIQNLSNIKQEKKEILELALAYYQLGHYFNPLRIEALFSCLTVLVRDILDIDHVNTSQLKGKIKDIMQKQDPTLETDKFDLEWNNCYINERCSIAHGRISKLINMENEGEYNDLVNKVVVWARNVIHYFLENNQKV